MPYVKDLKPGTIVRSGDLDVMVLDQHDPCEAIGGTLLCAASPIGPYSFAFDKPDYAVALVCYNRESRFLAIDVLWCALPPSYGYGLLRKFMMDLIYAIMVVAGETLDQYMLITPYDYMLGAFQENCPCVNDRQYILPVAIQTAVRADEPEKFLYILRGIVTPLEESYERTRQAQSTIGYSLKNQTLPGFTLHKNISGLPNGLET